MRRRLPLIAAVLLCCLCPFSTAQDAPRRVIIGEPAPDVDPDREIKEDERGGPRPGEKKGDGSILGRHRGKIVVLFFFRSSDSDSMEALTLMNKLNKDMSTKGVVVIGWTPERKEKVEGVIKGKEIRFDTYSGGYTPEIYNVVSYPVAYLIDTNGIVVKRFHPLQELEETVKAQIARTPPVGSDPESLKQRLKDAAAHLEKKEYGRAYTLAKDVSGTLEKDSNLSEAAKKLVDTVQEGARKAFDEARKAAEAKEYDKSFPVLAELSIRFEGTDLGRDVDVELGRLMGDRELKARILRAKDNARGELVNDEAAELVATKRYVEALNHYREVVDRYPDTDSAKVAEKAIDQITNDPKVKNELTKRRAEEEAERWLDLGERFRRAALYGKAREYYEKVLEAHGGSRAADRARERLKNLPEDEPEEVIEEEDPNDAEQARGGG